MKPVYFIDLTEIRNSSKTRDIDETHSLFFLNSSCTIVSRAIKNPFSNCEFYEKMVENGFIYGHPTLNPLIKFEEKGEGNLILYSQYFGNNTLQDYVEKAKRGCCPIKWENLLVKVIFGIADALYYLSKNNIFPNNIKMSNIVFNSNRNPLLTDFYTEKNGTKEDIILQFGKLLQNLFNIYDLPPEKVKYPGKYTDLISKMTGDSQNRISIDDLKQELIFGDYYIHGCDITLINDYIDFINMDLDYNRALANRYIECANVYDTGKYVSLDVVKATLLFKHAAELGSPEAQYTYPNRCWKGIGIIPSPEKVQRFAKMSAEQNYALGLNLLGLCFLHGIGGLEKNTKTACEYFKQAIKYGNPNSNYNLALVSCYTNEKFVNTIDAFFHLVTYMKQATSSTNLIENFFKKKKDSNPQAVDFLLNYCLEQALKGNFVYQYISAYLCEKGEFLEGYEKDFIIEMLEKSMAQKYKPASSFFMDLGINQESIDPEHDLPEVQVLYYAKTERDNPEKCFNGLESLMWTKIPPGEEEIKYLTDKYVEEPYKNRLIKLCEFWAENGSPYSADVIGQIFSSENYRNLDKAKYYFRIAASFIDYQFEIDHLKNIYPNSFFEGLPAYFSGD